MIVELNIRAKSAYEAFQKRKRRNEMAHWRKAQVLTFSSKENFNEWLNYTKWHKRPVKIEEKTSALGFTTVTVEFLDYKGKKNV